MVKFYFLLTFLFFSIIGPAQSQPQEYSYVPPSDTVSYALSSIQVSKIELFPNPFENKIYIQAKSPIKKILLYNMLGKVILKKMPEENRIVLDATNIQSGIYMVYIKTEEQVRTLKMVK